MSFANDVVAENDGGSKDLMLTGETGLEEHNCLPTTELLARARGCSCCEGSMASDCINKYLGTDGR